MSVSFPINAPIVRFVIHVDNGANGTSLQTESLMVLTKDFQEVHELLDKFHAFIRPIQDESFGRAKTPSSVNK